MGAWNFVAARIEAVLDKLEITLSRPGYAGRAAAASTATGSHLQHVREQSGLVDAALQGDRGHQDQTLTAGAA
jgi:2-oxoglutarate dehydrogenase E1 component